jgi:benzoyl-CoA reductase/2-hydroxyglutaryl-CoA dehydratase subunit BcrC/BadD/HgdB
MITRRLQYELAGRVMAPLLTAIERRQAERRTRRRQGRESPLGPPLESLSKLKELMITHYYQARYADGAVPVAWVTSGFPVELLRPWGFYIIYPENHGALCAARRMVPELSDVAEAAGYSRDLCGYARGEIGSVLSGRTPVGRVPKPDLLACCTNICQTVLYWYRALSRQLNVPLLLVDTPYVYGESTPHELAYIEAQLEEVSATAARITGRQIGPDAVMQALALGLDASLLWGNCIASGKNKPSPWTAFDGFIHMAPVVALRGTQACVNYYRLLSAELADRASRGIGGVRNEQHRLLWDNLPIWYRIRDLATSFAQAGANFVCATYTNAWADTAQDIDPRQPIASAARAYANIILNRDLKNRIRLMVRMAREFSVDGVVLHSDRSCKPYSIGQVDLKEKLAQELGVPVLMLDADHADPRSYTEEQVSLRAQAFLETLS